MRPNIYNAYTFKNVLYRKIYSGLLPESLTTPQRDIVANFQTIRGAEEGDHADQIKEAGGEEK